MKLSKKRKNIRAYGQAKWGSAKDLIPYVSAHRDAAYQRFQSVSQSDAGDDKKDRARSAYMRWSECVSWIEQCAAMESGGK